MRAADRNIGAVVLAGGFSSRMQRFKPLLPFGCVTVIENVIAILRESEVHGITVVTGHRANEIERTIAGRDIRIAFNPGYAKGMYSSVVTGIRALAAGTDACLLIPGDMPLVTPETVRAVRQIFEQADASIVYPVFQGRRGHPTLIGAHLFSEIISGDGEGGLRTLLSRHDGGAIEVEVTDEGILIDLDTPQDYTRACELAAQRGSMRRSH